jgi:peptidyl-prolyl cis-trans isomerase D
MLTAFRAFAKSPWAAGLIVLLIASFAVFGIRDVFKAKVQNAVITAGDRSVSAGDFKRTFDRVKAQKEQEIGQPITAEVAAANGLDRQILTGMATSEAFADALTKMGVRPSAKLVLAQIEKIPDFFDQVSGRFDKNAYLSKLARNDMTAPVFEGRLRDDLAQDHAARGLVAGLSAPRAYAALAAIYGTESRDIGYFVIEPGSVPVPPPPTDAQLQQLMKENAQRLTLPEFRVLTVVQFSPQMVAANLPVDPAEVQKRFNFKKDTLSAPETRTIIKVPAKDAAAAAQIVARLNKGEDPNAVAKSLGVETISYAGKPQSAIPDKKLAAAVFQLPAGQVASVTGDLGMAVVKVVSVTPGHSVTLEEVRPAIEAEVRKDAAAEKVYALTQAYEDAQKGGASLQAAAQKTGVPARTIGPITQGGRDMQGQQVPGLTQKLVETAWSLQAGGESEIEDAGNGEYFALRVEKIIPSALRPFEEIRPQLVQAWTQRELATRMEARADALAARVKKGETLDAVAASAGATVEHVPGVSRQNARQNQILSQDMLAKAFTARPGDAFSATFSHFAYVVGKLDAIHTGDVATLAQMSEQVRPQMTQAFFREMGESAYIGARQRTKVVMDTNRAREAIGLEPLNANASTPVKGAKPGLAK